MKTKMLFFLLAILFLALQSCSPPIRTNLSGETLRPLQEEDQIIVLEVGEEVPQNSQYLGSRFTGDPGFTGSTQYFRGSRHRPCQRGPVGTSLPQGLHPR